MVGYLRMQDFTALAFAPLAILSASVRITGYRRSDCRRGRRESIYVRSGPNPDSICKS